MKLFIDSCDYLTLGLLDDKNQWVDYEQFSTRKNSEVVHAKIYEMLSRAGLKLHQIKTAFHVAGPGSYTGMRLSDGICQILKWQGVEIYSFYHFEVPQLLEMDNWIWISEAFKGELFTYAVNREGSPELLIKKDGLENESFVEKFYGSYDHVFSHYPSGAFTCEYTSDLIRKHGASLFETVLKNQLRRESYYYRPLEKEFTQTQRA